MKTILIISLLLMATGCSVFESAKGLITETEVAAQGIKEVVKTVHDWLPTFLYALAGLVIAAGAYFRGLIWKKRACNGWKKP